MKFSGIVPHLGKRGFVSRKLWRGQTVMFFGMDNTSWMANVDRRPSEYWQPNLEEIKASDWFKLPYFWDGGKDNYLPFDQNDVALKKLRSANEHQPTAAIQNGEVFSKE